MASNVCGGDWAMAAEVFRKYDADGSGRLDRDELLAALRDLGLLARVSVSAAGRELAAMDTNGDGVVSFEEFREAYSRLARLQANEQRQERLHRKPAPIPPSAATDPRLRAAFQHFASWGAAKGLSEKAEKADGLNSRQFQRACSAAGLAIESAAADVVFTMARKGSRTLSFMRFLEALSQVALESGMGLDAVLEAVRAVAPGGASRAREVESKLPLSARGAGRRPKSPSAYGSAEPEQKPYTSSSPGAAPGEMKDSRGTTVAAALPAAAAVPAGRPGSAGAPLNKLNQQFTTLQKLLEAVEGEEDSIPAAHMQPQREAGGHSTAGVQGAEEPGDGSLLTNNPTYLQTQNQEAGSDLGAFKVGLLALMDQRCEAAEASCRAMAATCSEMGRQVISQVSAAMANGGASATPHHEVQEALHSYEAHVAAAEGRIGDAVREVAGECRAAVAALDARLDSYRRSNEEALRKFNEALLLIAKRVGTLSAGQ